MVLGASAASYTEKQTNEVNQALAALPHPQSAADFPALPHLACRNQGNTELCWSFATSSFLEAERARLKMEPVRISTLYFAYCQYLEKTKQLIKTRGASRFANGDLFAGVVDACRLYGAMPAEVYDHDTPGKIYDQKNLYAELEKWTQKARKQNKWDEEKQLKQVKAILKKYLSEPPASFTYQGKSYTPRTFFDEVVRLNLSDYVLVTSWTYAPFNQFTELKVPDNWKHQTNFFNVPLPVFYDSIKGALQSGYSVATDVDDTEPTYEITRRYSFITDSPVTQEAREAGFESGATTDDHLIHLVGWTNISGEDWFLAKDSAKSIWSAHHEGYVFAHSSYIKLKYLAFLVHKDAVPKIKALLPKE